MTLQTTELSNALQSHAMGLGHFERTVPTPPTNGPGNGLTYAVWPNRIRPSRRNSGLAQVSAAVTYFGRIHQPAGALPADDDSTQILTALDALLAAYCGDFTLGGLIKNVDIFGAEGTELDVQAGWIRFDDSAPYRIYTITIPLVINDAWSEEA